MELHLIALLVHAPEPLNATLIQTAKLYAETALLVMLEDSATSKNHLFDRLYCVSSCLDVPLAIQRVQTLMEETVNQLVVSIQIERNSSQTRKVRN